MGVITVLIALLLPALSKRRTYAKKVQCMNNLRQCGMAVLSYGNESKGWLPYNDGGINIWDPFSVCTNTTGGYWIQPGTDAPLRDLQSQSIAAFLGSTQQFYR